MTFDTNKIQPPGVSNGASRIPDWSRYGFTRPEGAPILVGSLEAWGRLLVMEECPLQLPVFQRGTAWNEARVELFWDSLARGYPIGTLLLSTTRDVKSRPLPEGQFQGSTLQTPAHYDALVVDGQQRCVALKLGFQDWHPGDTSRLWLDLASAARFFDSAPYSPNANPFRLCSVASLWGRLQDERPRLSQRRRARRAIGHSEFHDRHLTLAHTFPLSRPTQLPPLPVPLSKLLVLVLKRQDVSLEQCVTLVPDGALILHQDDVQLVAPLTKDQRAELEFAAMNQLHTEDLSAFLRRFRERLEDALIACFGTQLQHGEDLIEAFVRVNRQGVVLSEAELFFSGVKHEWAEANDLVHRIVNDPALGHTVKATEIVHAAVRLAVSRETDSSKEVPDVPRLTVESFRRLLRTDVDRRNRLLEGLGFQLQVRDGATKARLHELFLKSRNILMYRRNNNDPGLPKPLLAKLRWRTWHALVAWLDRHEPTEDLIERSRSEVLRFVFLDYFFIEGDATDVIRKPFLLARRGAPDSLFPGREIYSELQAYLSTGLLTPEDYQKRVEGHQAPWDILGDELALVLWAQREWLSRWFDEFDPVADDVPFDIDHIMPSSFFDGRSVGNRIAREVAIDFEKNRIALRESIGNKRAWPREANRSDQEEPPTGKLFVNRAPQEEVGEDSYLAQWYLRTVGAVREASVIPEEEVELWRKASGGDNWDWSDPERFTAFRRAVDMRRVGLYRRFFRELGFMSWVNNDASLAQGPEVRQETSIS